MYNAKATSYAENFGIIKYRVNKNKMIWNVSYPEYLDRARYTVQFEMNLDDGSIYSHNLKRYDPQSECNR